MVSATVLTAYLKQLALERHPALYNIPYVVYLFPHGESEQNGWNGIVDWKHLHAAYTWTFTAGDVSFLISPISTRSEYWSDDGSLSGLLRKRRWLPTTLLIAACQFFGTEPQGLHKVLLYEDFNVYRCGTGLIVEIFVTNAAQCTLTPNLIFLSPNPTITVSRHAKYSKTCRYVTQSVQVLMWPWKLLYTFSQPMAYLDRHGCITILVTWLHDIFVGRT